MQPEAFLLTGGCAFSSVLETQKAPCLQGGKLFWGELVAGLKTEKQSEVREEGEEEVDVFLRMRSREGIFVLFVFFFNFCSIYTRSHFSCQIWSWHSQHLKTNSQKIGKCLYRSNQSVNPGVCLEWNATQKFKLSRCTLKKGTLINTAGSGLTGHRSRGPKQLPDCQG